MKKYYLLFLFIMLISCKQKDPADIIYKGDALYKITYENNGKYIEGPDGKIVRSLRNKSYSNEEKEIIDNDAVLEEKNTKEKNSTFYKTNFIDGNLDGYYRVVDGDNLWSIAKEHNMKVTELADLNNIQKPYIIKAGDYLKVNKESKDIKIKDEPKEKNQKQTYKTETYTVKSGDTFTSIANLHNMTLDELVELNEDIKKPYTIKVGDKVKVNKAVSSQKKSVKQEKQSVYVVKSGDTLSQISENFDIPSSDIIKMNNLKSPYTLYVGQKLKLNGTANTNKPEKIVVSTKTNNIENKSKKVSKKDNQFIWPIKGKVISNFGTKANGLSNDGINISAEEGTEFKSVEDGVVVYVGNELRGYGNIILIKHNNWISVYAHCETTNVNKGDRVTQGQIIGTVGKTGNVSEPQLYFSLRKGREAVDPLKYFTD